MVGKKVSGGGADLKMENWQSSVDISHPETALSHKLAVEQVIQVMRDRLYEVLSVEDMADIAHLSPFYFNRIFHRLIGIPPGEFLAALRLDEAKRLLLTTPLSVTEVCFEIGYSSLGSFTTRFTNLVGLPPGHLRQIAKEFVMPSQGMLDDWSTPPACASLGNGLSGTINAPTSFIGMIFVGLFSKPIPQGRPVRCTLLPSCGPYSINHVPDGSYYVLTAGLPFSKNAQAFLSPSVELLVGKSQHPVFIHSGKMNNGVDITLRPLCLTDPPLLLALPFL